MAPLIDSFFGDDDELDALKSRVIEGFVADPPKVSRLIKSNSKGRVAEGEWQGQSVIIKEIFAGDRQKTITKLEAEHRRLRALFPYGKLNFVACLATAPKAGMIILPKITGKPLEEAMRTAPPGQRDDILGQAIAWLVRSMEGQRDTGQFSPGYWIGKLQAQIDDTDLHWSDAELLSNVVATLWSLARQLDGGPVPRGPIHGDFSSQNMFWDAATGVLHVFDVKDHWVAPVAMDVGRLLGNLTYKALQDEPSTELDRGLAAYQRRLVMAAPGLDHPDNPGGYMDFMTGQRHASVLLAKLDHPLGPYVRRALQHWLNALSG